MKGEISSCTSTFTFTLLALLMAGCGTSPPVLSELSLTRELVSRGEEFLAQVHVEDDDGDIDQGVFTIRMILEESSDPEDELELEQQIPMEGLLPDTTTANPILALALSGDKVIGIYRVEIELEDEAGNNSETVTATIGCNF